MRYWHRETTDPGDKQPPAPPPPPPNMVDPRLLGIYVEKSKFYSERFTEAEHVILALRRKLREADPTLPIEYDGNSWRAVESPYYTDRWPEA